MFSSPNVSTHPVGSLPPQSPLQSEQTTTLIVARSRYQLCTGVESRWFAWKPRGLIGGPYQGGGKDFIPVFSISYVGWNRDTVFAETYYTHAVWKLRDEYIFIGTNLLQILAQ